MLKYHIQTVELTSAQAQISFNSIPQDFTDLLVVWSTRHTSNSTTKTRLAFNGSTTNFSYRLLQGSGSAAASGANTINLGGITNGSETTANTFSNNQMYIPNYTGSTNKSYSVDSISENNATTAYQDIWAGLWSNTAAITSITISGESGGTLAAGSSVSLYGVRRGDDRVTGVSPVAVGGTVTTSGGYTIHTFTTSGTLSVNRTVDADYLIVAGGGGGGNQQGGGGGAGGYLTGSLPINASTNYTIAVGAGGTGGTPGINGFSGGNSSFGSVVSTGGGGGATLGFNAQNGGSGGGGSIIGSGLGAAGNGTVGQGFAGGTGFYDPTSGAGGGGGASAVGQNKTSTTGAAGGNGLISSINGTAVARAGGGGGGSFTTGPAGAGGSGGGGAGSNQNTAGVTGTANTGGGGGGGGQNYSGVGPGAAGGSGVVIIRYLTP